MSGYTLSLTCPRCGGATTHVASGRPIAGTEAGAICKCRRCRQSWHVLVTVRLAVTPETERKQRSVERRKANT